MKNLQLFSCLLLAASILTTIRTPVMSGAAVPMLINYQGELRDPNTGGALEGTYDILFRI